MTLPDFLTEHPHDDSRLTGHRFGLFHVVSFCNEGYSPAMLVEQFPTLELALVHKVSAICLENRTEVGGTYVANDDAELEEQQAAVGPLPSLVEWRRRIESIGQVEKV